jgi:hypothetical protein
MFYVLSWLAVASLLALWSLAVWAAHAVGVWTVTNAGALSGAAAGVEGLALPAWLAPWVPPELVQAITQAVAWFGPMLDSLLQAVPALAGGLTVVAWGLWGIGSLLLVLLGAGAHLLIALWRRGGGGGSGPRAGSPLAAG